MVKPSAANHASADGRSGLRASSRNGKLCFLHFSPSLLRADRRVAETCSRPSAQGLGRGFLARTRLSKSQPFILGRGRGSGEAIERKKTRYQITSTTSTPDSHSYSEADLTFTG